MRILKAAGMVMSLVAVLFLTFAEGAPVSFAVSQGDIIVFDIGGTFRVDPLTGDRTIISSFAPPGRTSGDIDFLPTGGLLATGDAGILEIDLGTGSVLPVSTLARGTGPFFTIVNGIAPDGSGDVIVTSRGPTAKMALFRVDLATGDRVIVSDPSTGSGSPFVFPGLPAVQSDGSYVVPNSSAGHIIHVDRITGNRTVLGVAPDNNPISVVIAPSGDYYISFGGQNWIASFDGVSFTTVSAGTDSSFGVVGVGPDLGDLWDMELDSVGNLIAASQRVGGVGTDGFGGAVFEVDPLTGDRFIVSGTTRGSGPPFLGPVGIALALPSNAPPNVETDIAVVTIDEGQPANNSGSVGDPDGDLVTLSASLGSVTNNSDGTWSWSFLTSDGPAQSQTVTITADDGNGGSAQAGFLLTVNNVAPSVDEVLVPLDPVQLGTGISVSGAFSDPAGVNDELYTCTANYGDGTGNQAGSVAGVSCTGPGHTYASPGVYTVSVAVTDKDGATGSTQATQFIVVYDPSGGFVTGGGWIDSPANACQDFCGGAVGKANFGFVSKYKKGATVPTGQTEFNFKAGGLNFHSSSYDWLVIAGAKAMYKGTGTINGTGSYTFQLNAIDGQVIGGGGVDKFRIKIKDAGGVIYDNQPLAGDNDDPTTAIGGGSIKIHKGK